MIYLDTGCLLKLYFPEPESNLVAKLVSNDVIRFSGLHELELHNALELKVFRKEATPAQVKATAALVEADLSAGVLHRAALDWGVVLKSATELAIAHSAKLGCRTLDIMHCAAAASFGDKSFITTDVRQRRLAQKIGLHCPKV